MYCYFLATNKWFIFYDYGLFWHHSKSFAPKRTREICLITFKVMLLLMLFQYHYYQPMWTLVGAGLKDANESTRQMGSVMPRNCTWIKEKVMAFDPDQNTLVTDSDKQVSQYTTQGCTSYFCSFVHFDLFFV